MLQRYGVQHHRSSAYRPQTNGAVEAANKNIKRILRKMVETSRDWSEKLPFALWAYRTSFRTSTGATPYSLVYGMEAVLAIEIEMGSLRVTLEQTNGAVEAGNKNIKRILRKMVETSRDWSEKLPFALWAYRTSFRTSTGATPYSLVYGMEAVLPIEIEMGSLRVTLEQQISKTEWAQSRFDQLSLLDVRRLRAGDHVQAYQRKMARAFKKRVKPRPLQRGDMVLRILRGLAGDPRGKFRPTWSGPYIIRELTPEGAAWLTDLDGNQFSESTNVDQLKKYYV